MRSTLNTKESTIKRIAKLFDEFQYSLQQARFQSRKVTIEKTVSSDPTPADTTTDLGTYRTKTQTKSKKKEVVEIISTTEEMESALLRLNEVLNISALAKNEVRYNKKFLVTF